MKERPSSCVLLNPEKKSTNTPEQTETAAETCLLFWPEMAPAFRNVVLQLTEGVLTSSESSLFFEHEPPQMGDDANITALSLLRLQPFTFHLFPLIWPLDSYFGASVTCPLSVAMVTVVKSRLGDVIIKSRLKNPDGSQRSSAATAFLPPAGRLAFRVRKVGGEERTRT